MDVTAEALHLLGTQVPTATPMRGLRNLVELGLPSETVDHLLKRIPTRIHDRTRKRFLTGTATGELRLSRSDSERIARLAFLLALSHQVWGSWERTAEFLIKPHPALRDESPIDAASSEWGLREVESLLRHIQFGLPV